MNSIEFYGETSIGKVRTSNEDQVLLAKHPQNNEILAVVCDGMGGAKRGDYASKLAVDMVKEAFNKGGLIYKLMPKQWLKNTIRSINRCVYDFGDKNEEYAHMGTTLVAALLIGKKILIANVGDSRAYVSTTQGLRQVTIDHTYVEFLYRTGQISKNDMETHQQKHVLLNAIGTFPSVNIDVFALEYNEETILLCSDGLYNSVGEREIWAVLQTSSSAITKTEQLIKIANANGGPDNIAICIIQKEVNDND